MSTAVFIVGPPAAGKTTLARRLLGPVAKYEIYAKPKWTRGTRARFAAGHYTGDTFDGADRVGYSQVRASLDFWSAEIAHLAELTIFDGDRFSFESARNFVAQYVDRVCCIYVWGDPLVLAARRKARDWAPNPAWLKGRETKADRFFLAFPEVDRLPPALATSNARVTAFLKGRTP